MAAGGTQVWPAESENVGANWFEAEALPAEGTLYRFTETTAFDVLVMDKLAICPIVPFGTV